MPGRHGSRFEAFHDAYEWEAARVADAFGIHGQECEAKLVQNAPLSIESVVSGFGTYLGAKTYDKPIDGDGSADILTEFGSGHS